MGPSAEQFLFPLVAEFQSLYTFCQSSKFRRDADSPFFTFSSFVLNTQVCGFPVDGFVDGLFLLPLAAHTGSLLHSQRVWVGFWENQGVHEPFGVSEDKTSPVAHGQAHDGVHDIINLFNAFKSPISCSPSCSSHRRCTTILVFRIGRGKTGALQQCSLQPGKLDTYSHALLSYLWVIV